MNGIEFEKLASLVRGTEMTLEKTKEKLNTARTPGTVPFTMKLDHMVPVYNDMSRSQTLPFTNFLSSFHVARSATAAGIPSSDFDLSDADQGYTTHDTSTSLVSLLNDKIDAQAKTIDQLSRNLQRSDEERDSHSRMVRELRDEMSRLRGRVAERGVDLATEEKVRRWQHECSSEIQSVNSQLVTLRNRMDEMCAKNGALATAVLELQRFVNGECEYLRREINLLKNQIGTVEADVASMAQRSADNKQQLTKDRDSWKSQSQNVSRGVDPKNSVSFYVPPYGSGVIDVGYTPPDTTQLAHIKSEYQDIKRKLSALESHLLTDSLSGTGRSKPRTRKRSSLRRSSESYDQTSATTSDLDLSTATNTMAVFAHRESAQSFDDFMHSTDTLSDMSSDGGYSQTLDDL